MFRQENLTSAQWYEPFNTNIDVGTAIGVTRQHEALLKYCANDHTAGATYDTLAGANKLTVRNDAEERYISYVFFFSEWNATRKSKGRFAERIQNRG